MSTRACYIFEDDDFKATVYIHHDGYPGYAWRYFAAALQGNVWQLPRYEPDEFAAGFIAENKDQPGGVRVVDRWNRCADIAFLYTLTMRNHVLLVKVEQVDLPSGRPSWPSRWERTTLYQGPLHRWLEVEGDTGAAHRSLSHKHGRTIVAVNRALQAKARMPNMCA